MSRDDVPDHRQLCRTCGCHRATHHPGGVCLGSKCACTGYETPAKPDRTVTNPALRWTP